MLVVLVLSASLQPILAFAQSPGVSALKGQYAFLLKGGDHHAWHRVAGHCGSFYRQHPGYFDGLAEFGSWKIGLMGETFVSRGTPSLTLRIKFAPESKVIGLVHMIRQGYVRYRLRFPKLSECV